jgi:hypothetical protein
MGRRVRAALLPPLLPPLPLVRSPLPALLVAAGAGRRAAGRAGVLAEPAAGRRPDEELAAPLAFAVVRFVLAISTAPASAGCPGLGKRRARSASRAADGWTAGLPGVAECLAHRMIDCCEFPALTPRA